MCQLYIKSISVPSSSFVVILYKLMWFPFPITSSMYSNVTTSTRNKFFKCTYIHPCLFHLKCIQDPIFNRIVGHHVMTVQETSWGAWRVDLPLQCCFCRGTALKILEILVMWHFAQRFPIFLLFLENSNSPVECPYWTWIQSACSPCWRDANTTSILTPC